MFKTIPGLLLIVLLSSCYSANKALKQTLKAQALYPEVLANACNNIYNRPDSIYTHELVIKGDTILLLDTVVNYDTINNIKHAYIHRTIHTTDTIVKTRFVQVSDKAALHLLQSQLAAANAELIKQTQLLKIWRTAAIVCGFLILIWIVIRLWLNKLL